MGGLGRFGGGGMWCFGRSVRPVPAPERSPKGGLVTDGSCGLKGEGIEGHFFMVFCKKGGSGRVDSLILSSTFFPESTS